MRDKRAIISDLTARESTKVLFVDDDRAFINVMTERLKMNKLDVTPAESAKEALEWIRKDVFDVVVTDIRMPGMDGIQLLKEIRNIDSHLPVILVTGFGTIDDMQQAIKLHTWDYLFKPFSTVELLKSIENATQSYNVYKTFLNLIDYYYALVDLIPAGIVTLDKHKRILNINNKFAEMFKLFDDVVGKDHAEVFDDFICKRISELGQEPETHQRIINGSVGKFTLQNYDINKKNYTLMVITDIDITVLSDREKEITFKMLENKKRSEIAKELDLSLNTVNSYIFRINKKLKNRVNLSLWRERERERK